MLLKKTGYIKTAKVISRLAGEVLTNKIADEDELEQKLKLIFAIFEEETQSTWGEYRLKCFKEIHGFVIGAHASILSEENFSFPDEYSRYLDKMNENTEKMDSASQEFSKVFLNQKRSAKKSILMFDLACHIYLNAVEGVFGELAKLVYAFTNISEAKTILTDSELNADHVWAIYRKFEKLGIKPVFLENWETKSQIRNAIAHGQAKYDPIADKAHFYSTDKTGKIVYDKFMTMNEFVRIFLQILDAEDALRLSLTLTEITLTLQGLFLVRKIEVDKH